MSTVSHEVNAAAGLGESFTRKGPGAPSDGMEKAFLFFFLPETAGPFTSSIGTKGKAVLKGAGA